MKRCLVIVFCLGWLAASQAANAATITLTVGKGGSAAPPDYILGDVIPPLTGSSGGQVARDVLVISTLLDMSPGQSLDPYYRSTTVYASLPIPVEADAVPVTGGGLDVSSDKKFVTIYLPAALTYQYLIATWDGKQSGSQAWYIGSIAAGSTILMPYLVKPVDGHLAVDPQKHEMSHYTLLNPTTAVPDGGTTAFLLGLSMLGLGFARRRKARVLGT